MIHLYPQPDEQGVADMRRILKEKYGRDVTDDEARRMLLPIMRYLYGMYWKHADDVTALDGSNHPK